MSLNTNFEDNIFILNTKIRNVSDLLLLDADPGLFLNKTLEDLAFISATINLILDKLVNNKHLISRDEQLHRLYETIEVFLDMLSNMLRGSPCFSVQKYPLIEGTIKSLTSVCKNQLKLIDETAVQFDTQSTDQRVVSSDELAELLKDI
ncbi:MAG: hypothetical protein LBV52_00115 [Spirochaetaceae bacterium]|jgi:hypothetical protein|nr:hypothetical protein [Spirochaetaceae bacterium]